MTIRNHSTNGCLAKWFHDALGLKTPHAELSNAARGVSDSPVGQSLMLVAG